jgi:ribosomal protein S18 acetylase RimI-like enzyme
MQNRETKIRDAVGGELDAVARLWFDGWNDAHAAIVPDDLARLRTLKSFRARLDASATSVRVAVWSEAPVGFSMLKGDELYQFYVSSQARGTEVASQLMSDALMRLRSSGTTLAWLACAVGNERAARFYEKTGWRRGGTMISQLETDAGLYPLEVWRYEIDLAP